MNEMRIKFLLDALSLANDPEDFNFRAALRRELAVELRLTPPKEIACGGIENEKARLEVIEDHFDRVCEEKQNLKEAIRLISESF